MTIEEAILQLELNRPTAYTELREAIDMAIVALKKQIIKKPIKIKKSYWTDYLCPNCKELLGNTIEVDRSSLCPCCGQALNWLEV